jgi:hypothetical protein
VSFVAAFLLALHVFVQAALIVRVLLRPHREFRRKMIAFQRGFKK